MRKGVVEELPGLGVASAAAILLAAGSGERLGKGSPKAFTELAGQPMLSWSLATLQAVQVVERIVVTLPRGERAPGGTVGVQGGATRSHSVRAALPEVEGCKYVVIHDAARPFASRELFERVLWTLREDGCDGAVAAAPVTDTVKQADEDGYVEQTLDRARLWAVQTPQAFRYETLVRALEVSDLELAAATDDASLVERSGGRIKVVEATTDNFKITTPRDFGIAEMVLGRGFPYLGSYDMS